MTEVGRTVHMERGTPTTPQKSGDTPSSVIITPDIVKNPNESDQGITEVGTGSDIDPSEATVKLPNVDKNNAVVQGILRTGKARETRSAITTYMMLGMQQGATDLPTLKTETWPYGSGKVPNPLSIAKGRRILATGLAKVPCGIPGTGIHGHAFMAETETMWNKRNGTGDYKDIVAAIPQKSEMPVTTDISQILLHTMTMQPYRLYHHLKEVGKDKLNEWFGTAMFVDMYRDGALPPETTPNMMFEHLEGTYAQPNHFRLLMTEVEREHDSAYSPHMTVENYFMTLQEARERAALLEQPFTDKQTMNKATTKFIKAHGRDAERAERRWDKKAASDRTWTSFKRFWKEEIHSWTLSTGSRGNEESKVDTLATEVMTMRDTVSALQAENQAYQRENLSLRSQQIEVGQALQTEQYNRARDDQSYVSSKTSSDDISALTEAINLLTQDMKQIQTVVSRTPNAGRGKKYLYCWKCGCQTTHWTRQCRVLSKEDKSKYRTATGTNTMGGNEHQIERFGKYTADFRDN